MSDILIKNMEMPKGLERLRLTIMSDGSVYVMNCFHEGVLQKEKVEVLAEHGDLIDRDEIKWGYDPHFDTMHTMIDRLYEQPVVIPSSRVSTEGSVHKETT